MLFFFKSYALFFLFVFKMKSFKCVLLLTVLLLLVKEISLTSISNNSLEESIKVILNDAEFMSLSIQKRASVLVAIYWLLVDKYKFQPISKVQIQI